MSISVGITGVTGKFALCLIKALQTSLDVRIRGCCRDPSKLPRVILEQQQNRIEILKGEFDDRAAIEKFVRGTDVVICCYFGNADLMVQEQKLLIDVCEQEGVPRYIASDFAVDYTKIPDGAMFPKDSAKVIMQYLKSKRVEGVHIDGWSSRDILERILRFLEPKKQVTLILGFRRRDWEFTTYQRRPHEIKS